MASKKIRMHQISSREILEGNLKAVMRLILALAAHYKPASVKHHDVSYDGVPDIDKHEKPQGEMRWLSQHYHQNCEYTEFIIWMLRSNSSAQTPACTDRNYSQFLPSSREIKLPL